MMLDDAGFESNEKITGREPVQRKDKPAEQMYAAIKGDVLDTGFYVAAIAGLVGFVSGFLPSGWAQRRWTQTETVDDRGVNFDQPRV